MAQHQTDEGVLKHISQLVAEEQALYARPEVDDRSKLRLDALKVELDQCWDLLRQRRALREFDQDPDQAKVRPAAVVEKYEQ
jgi:trans-2-enoyl-CoA reductase